MAMTIEVPDEIAEAANELAARSGTAAEKLLLDALRIQFLSVPEDLREEFAMWERASDEDFEKFIREEEKD